MYENICIKHGLIKSRVSSTKGPHEEGYFEDYFECPKCEGERLAKESLNRIFNQPKKGA